MSKISSTVKLSPITKLTLLFDDMARFPDIICEKRLWSSCLDHLVSKKVQREFNDYIKTQSKEKVKQILLDDRNSINSVYDKAVSYGNTRVLLLLLNEAYKVMSTDEYLEYMNAEVFFNEIFYLYDVKFLKNCILTTKIRPKTLLSHILKSNLAPKDVKMDIIEVLLENDFPYLSGITPLTTTLIPEKYKVKAIKDYLFLNEGLDLKKNITEIFIVLDYLFKNKLENDLEFLLEKYELIKTATTDHDGHNILHFAARHNNIVLSQKIIKENPKLLNLTNQYSMTPLNIAFSHSNTKIIELFKENEAHANHIEWFEIPDEIFEYVACFLPLEDVMKMKLVNQHFFKIASSEVILQLNISTKFGYQSGLFRESWKQVYYSLIHSQKVVKMNQRGSYYGPFSVIGFCNTDWKEMGPSEIIKKLILEKRVPPKVNINFKFINQDLANRMKEEYRNELLDSIKNFQKDKISPYKQVDAYWRKIIEKDCNWVESKSLDEIKIVNHSPEVLDSIKKCFVMTNEELSKTLKGEKLKSQHSNIKIWSAYVQNYYVFWLIVTDDLLIFVVN